MAAHYIFDPNGSMRVRAQVGGEQGRYEIRADTLHLSNNQTFQLPAIAQFVIANDVLTLTPADRGPRAAPFSPGSTELAVGGLCALRGSPRD